MNRRSFLMAAGLAAGAALLRPPRAAAGAQQPLIQPSEIRSKDGVLRAALSAAPGRVQLGELAFPVTAALVGIYVFNSNLRWTQWIGVAITVAVVSLLPLRRREVVHLPGLASAPAAG